MSPEGPIGGLQRGVVVELEEGKMMGRGVPRGTEVSVSFLGRGLYHAVLWSVFSGPSETRVISSGIFQLELHS